MKDLDHQRNLVSLESSLVSNLSEYFTSRMPGLFNAFKVSVAMFERDTQTEIKLTSKQKDFLSLLKKTNYMNLSSLTVYVPEGMSVSYSEYIDHLRELTNFALSVPGEMESFYTFLARIASDENSQMSTDYVKDKMKKIADEHGDLERRPVFGKTSTTEVRLSEVVRNNSEWSDILARLNTINDDIEKLRKLKLQNDVERCRVLMDTLIKKSKAGELNKISPEMVQKIADYTYLVAKSLEIASIAQYRVLAFNNAVNSTISKLIQIIEG